MRLHFYAFKGRLCSFNGLLVMIIRHMRKARELDMEIAHSSSKIEELKSQLINWKRSAKELDQRKAKSLQKQANQLMKKMNREINSFCRNAREEIKDFKESNIDDFTLLYRGSRYLKDLAKTLIASKMNEKSRENLIRVIESEIRSTERKAKAFELQAKYLERGVASTVVLSQISPAGNRWIEGRIRRRAIEINQIYNILKNNKENDLPEYFEKMIFDIYEIGRNTNILVKRLRAMFSSIRAKLKNNGIPSRELDKTWHYFKATFGRMERISKRLNHEIVEESNKLIDEITKAKFIKLSLPQTRIIKKAA